MSIIVYYTSVISIQYWCASDLNFGIRFSNCYYCNAAAYIVEYGGLKIILNN